MEYKCPVCGRKTRGADPKRPCKKCRRSIALDTMRGDDYVDPLYPSYKGDEK